MTSNRENSKNKIKTIILSLSLFLTILNYAQTFPVGHMSINYKDASRTGGYAISGGINMTGTGRDIGAEVYYPSVVAGDNKPVASGQFPVVVIGHGFVMSWDSYDNIYNQLASKGYIVLLPRTEGGFSPSHSDFGNDLKFLVNGAQSLNSVTTPTILTMFNGKILSKSAIGGHSMGGGSSFLASANNSSITCIFNFAPATTNPSSITSASLINLPALIISGAIDCVADTNVQNSHYAALASSKKFHVVLKQLTHCDFGNGTNTNCTFGQSSSGCSSVISNTLASPRYMNYLQNFLDNQLKNDCAAGQLFMDSVNSNSSLRHGLKKLGSIACVATYLKDVGFINQIHLYPNPAHSKLYIQAAFKIFKVGISDLAGRKIYTKNFEEDEKEVGIDIEGLESGTYILQLENNELKKRLKFVKY